jgi:5-methylcytosine-specific restriction enzyme A
MASPITVYKNNLLLFEAKGIQQAATFLAEEFNTTKYKYFDHIERGYVYNIPYYIGEDEYRFVAPFEIWTNRRRELEESGHNNARRF